MQIYINKNGQQLGPFDENKVLEMLNNGQLSTNDLGIKQGQQQWQKLGALFPSFQPVSTPPPIAPVIQESQKPSGRLSIIRVMFGVFFVISFIVAHVLAYLMGPKFFEVGGNPMLWFGASAVLLALCYLLLFLLILGIGTKNGMSRWRTPLFCIFVMIWCFGLGGFIFSKISTPSRAASNDELLQKFKILGIKESDEMYQIATNSIKREESLGRLNYGLLGLGVLSLLGTGVSLIISGKKRK